MTYLQSVLSRLSVPGILCMALGLLLCIKYDFFAGKLFSKHKEKAALPIRIFGLILTALGTFILLDVIPGL